MSNFLLTRYDLAFKDFDDALLYLRGNSAINYEQLGLKLKLYAAEVLFNKGLCNIYMGRTEEGLMDMTEALKEKVTEEHNVINDAIQDRGDGYTVFSIVSVLLRFIVVIFHLLAIELVSHSRSYLACRSLI